MNLALIPHNDDESLFLSFTIQKHRANLLVVIVFDSHIQENRGSRFTAHHRRQESIAALKELGCLPPMFLGFSDTCDRPDKLPDVFRHLAVRHKPELVFAPAIEEGGHQQHNYVGEIATQEFPNVQHYMTYRRLEGKSTGTPVIPEPWMIQNKFRALTCYESQIEQKDCREHFLRDQKEYLA